MKNRRSAIIVAILVALVGTPRAWQEFSNVLAALQHKTQNKLLSMAVNSQVQESNQTEMVGGLFAKHRTPCPFTDSYQVAANHKPVDYSAPRQSKVERRALPSYRASSALAANYAVRKNRDVMLPRPEESQSWAGENQLTMHAIASVPRELMDKSSVTEFVTISQTNALPQVNPFPQGAPIPQVFVGKAADFIKLKKSFEECKTFRQKVRYVITRTPPALPIT